MAFAGEDLRMAELALDESLWNQVCFHAHQATEKALKALIVHKNADPPKTHSLMELLLRGEEPALGDLAGDLRSLESYYIPTRYPDALPGSLDEELPGEEEARLALATARKVSELVRETIEQAADGAEQGD